MRRDLPSPMRRRVLATMGCIVGSGCTTRREPTEGSSATSESDQRPTGPGDDDDPMPAVGSPLEARVEQTELIVNLDVPWDLAFTSTNELFVTERTGSLLRFETEDVLAVADDDVAPLDATAVPDADRYRELGDHLLGVTTHPTFPDPSFLYVYVTVDDGAEPYNRVLRCDPRAEVPGETIEILVDRIEGDHTIGGRLEFGPDDNLWVLIGTKDEERAQDPGSIGGSVLRVTPEGDPAPRNPSLGADADPRVFTYGHRNPQGIAWLPNNVPIVTDHGPTGRDEIERLSAGGNYGWPDARDENGYTDHPEFDRPLINTGSDETWAPANCVFYTGETIPAWRNRLIVATLQGEDLSIVTLLPPEADQPPLDGESERYDADWLDDRYTATVHHLLDGTLGRVRNVTQAPDGTVLASSSNRDGLDTEGDEFPRANDDVLVRLSSP